MQLRCLIVFGVGNVLRSWTLLLIGVVLGGSVRVCLNGSGSGSVGLMRKW